MYSISEYNKYLAEIYLSLVPEKCCEKLFSILKDVNNSYIPGLMGYGEHLYFYVEDIFPDLYDILKDKNLKEATEIFCIEFCKKYLKEVDNGHKRTSK